MVTLMPEHEARLGRAVAAGESASEIVRLALRSLLVAEHPGIADRLDDLRAEYHRRDDHLDLLSDADLIAAAAEIRPDERPVGTTRNLYMRAGDRAVLSAMTGDLEHPAAVVRRALDAWWGRASP